MESKSKQICLLEHTHENVCMRTPAVSTCMHACTHIRTQMLYEYEDSTCEHEAHVCKCVSPHLLSIRIFTYMPIKLITRTALPRLQTQRHQSTDKYLKKNVSYRSVIKKPVIMDVPFHSLQSYSFIWQRKPLQVHILNSFLKLFNAFPYHTCSIWAVI